MVPMQPSAPPSYRFTAPGARSAKAAIQVSRADAAPVFPTMFRQIRTGEIIVVVVVLVFLFGAKILPEPARSIEKSARELRKSLEVDLDDQDEPEA